MLLFIIYSSYIYYSIVFLSLSNIHYIYNNDKKRMNYWFSLWVVVQNVPAYHHHIICFSFLQQLRLLLDFIYQFILILTHSKLYTTADTMINFYGSIISFVIAIRCNSFDDLLLNFYTVWNLLLQLLFSLIDNIIIHWILVYWINVLSDKSI